jgi:hypothetical protein
MAENAVLSLIIRVLACASDLSLNSRPAFKPWIAVAYKCMRSRRRLGHAACMLLHDGFGLGLADKKYYTVYYAHKMYLNRIFLVSKIRPFRAKIATLREFNRRAARVSCWNSPINEV